MARTRLAAFLIGMASFFSIVAGQLRPMPAGGLPGDLFALGIASKIRTDCNSTASASSDFGRIMEAAPEAVLHPATPADIAALIRFSASSPVPFPVSARGQGHSVRGQSLAPGGVVVDMCMLGRGHHRINVSADYVDAGGEQLWVDVLRATLKHGLAPRSWTDYLQLTIGGTLSNAGIGGQAFRHGPQIANVHELDVVTGTGEMVTCSREYPISRSLRQTTGASQRRASEQRHNGAAHLTVQTPPRLCVRVVLLEHVVAFTRDQELLISKQASEAGFDYVEGQVQLNRTLTKGPKSTPFFSEADINKHYATVNKLAGLASETGSGAIYFFEAAMYYDETTAPSVDQKLEMVLAQMSFVPGFVFTKDVTYFQYLDRVRVEEAVLRSAGVWDVPHPWLNLFVPRSRILDFNAGVLKGILGGDNPVGLILMSPMNTAKWNSQMTAVTPPTGGDVFYTVGLLRSALSADELERLQRENQSVLPFCDKEGIECKQYLPYYTSQDGWQRHFGAKWSNIAQLKAKYDPHAIMSRGQRVFPLPGVPAASTTTT
ncbi:cytokinin dehydrogenase 7-like [Triticum aestivum]|uniref:cytokinin dehydrogenase 7-like n=1 Tax=Triticum aestivum TaxID=4565 RepID=UPI001D0094E9|nr:cytokinin dehydrogenase 7-like [Triticum aestivum]